MQSRFSKQVIFSALFIAITLMFVAGAFFYFRAGATCFDNRKNQGEEQVDCGGPCKSCDIDKLSPIQVINSQAIFIDNNHFSLSAEIINPNERFGAKSFHYTWQVNDTNGTLLRTIEGDSFLYPSETKYIIEPSLRLPFASVGNVVLSIEKENPLWEGIEIFSIPDITLRQVDTIKTEDNIVASGTFVNNEAYLLPRVRIVGVLFDYSGEVASVSKTEYRDAKSFSPRFFQVSFKLSTELVEQIDISRTKIFIETVLPR